MKTYLGRPGHVRQDMNMACHHKIGGKLVVWLPVQVMVEQWCFRVCGFNIVLDLQRCVVDANIVEPAHKHVQPSPHCIGWQTFHLVQPLF